MQGVHRESFSLVLLGLLAALTVALTAAGTWLARHEPIPAPQMLAEAVAPAPEPPAAIEPESDNPLLDPNATLVSDDLLARPLTEDEKASMAAELDRLKTRHARQLVHVIAAASAERASPIPASLLLSIAFTETHGKVLAVSPAGAAGLAQATPAAYLMEGFEGPVFITNQYLVGTRAYIMKKPLGDAVGIAKRVIEGEAGHSEALELLDSAQALRQVGMDELEALVPRAPAVFLDRVQAADVYNAAVLDELEDLLIRRAPKSRLQAFHDRVRKEYRVLLRVQQVNWERYADALTRERNKVLKAYFGGDPVKIVQQRPYEAGEVLGEQLDARFSPTQMALFLSQHLSTKRQQAIELGVPDDELEAWTAALYNGGLVNITRMRAGLMTSIHETQSYMRKVPDLRAKLEGAASVTQS